MAYVSLLQVDDINSVRTTPNHVLVKPGPENNYIVIKTKDEKIEVYIDGSYEPEKHSVTWGIVLCTPPYIDDELQSEMEVCKGDKIFFHYLCIMNAIRDNKYIICDSQVYFIVNYGSIFCAKRGEEVIVTNGHTLVEPIDDSLPEQTASGFIIPKSIRQKNSVNQGVVRYAGKPLKGDKAICDIGDTIFYRKNAVVPLQYELFSNFDKKRFYRIKNDHIYGIMK